MSETTRRCTLCDADVKLRWPYWSGLCGSCRTAVRNARRPLERLSELIRLASCSRCRLALRGRRRVLVERYVEWWHRSRIAFSEERRAEREAAHRAEQEGARGRFGHCRACGVELRDPESVERWRCKRCREPAQRVPRRS